MHYLRKKLHARVGGAIAAVVLMTGMFVPKVFGQTNQAQAGFNFSTTPVVANLETKPGIPITTKIQVKNNNLTTEHIKVSLLKFNSNNTDGTPTLLPPDTNDEFLKWVHFSEENFDAEPNVWKSIDVTITPPASAAFGYYYAVVFSRSTDVQNQRGVTNIAASVGVPILLDVQAPGAIRKADITEFTVNKNVLEFLPAKFKVTLKNSGNTHVAPRGNIFITKGGKNVGLLEVNQAKGNILPNSSRQFTADWNDGSPVYTLKEADGKVVLDKQGHQVSTLSWAKLDPSKIRFGKYHAKVSLVYDDGHGDVSTEAELDFWVIPWRILGFLLLALLFIGAGLWAVLIRPIRNRLKKLPGSKKQSTNVE